MVESSSAGMEVALMANGAERVRTSPDCSWCKITDEAYRSGQLIFNPGIERKTIHPEGAAERVLCNRTANEA